MYDRLGRKTRLIDPDLGTIHYRYNGLGQLLWQQDNMGQRKCMSYDGLERVKSEIHAKNSSCAVTTTLDSYITYEYDTAVNGLGLLANVYDNTNDINKEYFYNELSLSYREINTIEGKRYYQDTVYDHNNQFRVSKTYDASQSNSGVEYNYNSNNYLISKRDLVSNTPIWQLHTTDAWGNATQYRYGNGITTAIDYDDYDGTYASINATKGGTTIQNSTYHFDTVGNLEYRHGFDGFEEDFTYDSLNRLDSWTKSGSGASGTIDVTYDHLGNVTSKTGIGTYHYDNNSHAVSRITNGSLAGSFIYDGNGNMTSGGGRSLISYNVNNKPTRIVTANHTTEFAYSIDGARVKRSDIKGNENTTTLYVGNVEFVSVQGKLSRIQRTINGMAIQTQYMSTNVTTLEYLHFDHLGSADVITNEAGQVVKRFSFDPWGQRRSVDNYTTSFGLTSAVGLALTYYNKGYTGHEHMDESGLIHMNGRIYDPRLARFLNADPVVQQPTNLQNFNR